MEVGWERIDPGDGARDWHPVINLSSLPEFMSTQAPGPFNVDALLRQIDQLSLHQEAQLPPRVAGNIEDTLSLQNLTDRGLVTYYYEGEPFIESFRNWVIKNWVRQSRLHVLKSRPLGANFIFMLFETRQDRDQALGIKTASLSGWQSRLRQFAPFALLSTSTLEEHEYLHEEVRSLKQLQAHKQWLWAREKFLLDGEAPTAYYLRCFSAQSACHGLRSLTLSSGEVNSDQPLLQQHALQYYTSLYTQPQRTVEQETDLQHLLSVPMPQVSLPQQAFLNQIPSAAEIQDVLRIIPPGKAPGYNGLTADGVILLWPLLDPHTADFVSYTWTTHNFPMLCTHGLLQLIPKQDLPQTLSDRRPIALLTVFYKLIATVLALRLAFLWPSLVPASQQGFIRGRSVQVAFSPCHLLMNGSKERHMAIFLALDFDKAYDHLAFQFIWEVRRKMHLGEEFILLLKGPMLGGTAQFLLDGSNTPAFLIERGVCQGCPLAPLLFSLVSTPLILQIQQQASLTRIQTPALLHLLASPILCLADVTSFTLELDLTTLNVVWAWLAIYTSATGALINTNKTKMMQLGRYQEPPPWIRSLPYRLAGRSEVFSLKSKTALIAWSRVTSPTSDGGTGLIHLGYFQKALMAKYLTKAVPTTRNIYGGAPANDFLFSPLELDLQVTPTPVLVAHYSGAFSTFVGLLLHERKFFVKVSSSLVSSPLIVCESFSRLVVHSIEREQISYQGMALPYSPSESQEDFLQMRGIGYGLRYITAFRPKKLLECTILVACTVIVLR
ncbi:hypothetical protein R1flu_001778 [Riccia fluitans]|uniref:Reverse transcriptase domain-containing protein n=1 Tax=Riccia fluitans TaxID=41844 RepID=A0ABD1Y4H7_9MARC